MPLLTRSRHYHNNNKRMRPRDRPRCTNSLVRRRKLALLLPAFAILIGIWQFSASSNRSELALVQEKGITITASQSDDARERTSSFKSHETALARADTSSTSTIAHGGEFAVPTVQNKTLPTWMQDYVRFYSSQLKVSASGKVILKPDAKYLLWTCRMERGRSPGSCGGIGDRLNGIIQGLYMAMCTDRVLLVDWAYPYPLTALQPALLPWNTPVNVPPSQIIRTIDNRKDPYLLDPTLLPDDQGLELWGNLWLYEPIVRQTKCLQKYWAQHGGLDETTHLYQTAFWMLFKWNPTNVERANSLKQQSGLSQTASSKIRPYVGVHIRTGQGATWVDPVRHAGADDLQRFYECTRAVQEEIRSICPPPLTTKPSDERLDVYIASDNSGAKETLRDLEKDDYRQGTGNVTSLTFRNVPTLEVFHIDRSQVGRMHDPVSAELDVWAELSTLLDAVCLVTSKSKFSELPTWLSPQQPRCEIRFDHCSAENVTIALQALRAAGCPSYE